MIATKPGEIVASNIPSMKRTVARPAKEEHVAVIMRIEAQRMMLTVSVSSDCLQGWRKLASKELGDGKALH